MASSFLDLIQKFNVRTNTPRQTAFAPTDNNNIFVQNFANALARIQSDHNWPLASVLEYAIIGDGKTDEFPMPDGFVKLLTAQVFNHSVNCPLNAGSIEEILRARMLKLKGDALLKYCVREKKMIFSFAPQKGAKITFGYLSDALVLNYDQDTESFYPGNSFKTTQDKFRVDDELILLAAQLAYAEQMGFQDAGVLEEKYQRRLSWIIRRERTPFIKSLANDRGSNPLAAKLAAVEVLTQPYGW